MGALPGIIKKAHERDDLVKPEYMDDEKPISGNKRGKRSCWKGSMSLHRGVLAETTVCYWEEWNTPEGHEIDKQIYTIEMHAIEVVA